MHGSPPIGRKRRFQVYRLGGFKMRQKARGAKVEAANGPERGRKKWLAREEENKDGEGGKRRGASLLAGTVGPTLFSSSSSSAPSLPKRKGKEGALL